MRDRSKVVEARDGTGTSKPTLMIAVIAFVAAAALVATVIVNSPSKHTAICALDRPREHGPDMVEGC